MRLAALIQLYLPYVFPRGDDWQGKGVTTVFHALDLRWRPRGLAEPLFPNDVDQTLSTMTMQLRRISLPVSEISIAVKDVVFDRIEVVGRGEFNAESQSADDIDSRAISAAVAVTNAILQHCRILSQTSFVFALEEHFRIEDHRRYFLFPRSITWFDGESEKPFRLYGHANATCSSGAVRSPERGYVAFVGLEQSLHSGAPDLVQALLLDAEEHLITLRVREALLSLGTACEIASNRYISVKGVDNDVSVTRALDSRASFAEKRFHMIPSSVSGRSLRSEDVGIFTDVERLYRTRNSVAHRGDPTYEERGTVTLVDVPLASKFLQSARKAVSWLQAL